MASFKDNLDLLPSIDGVASVEIIDHSGNVIDTIENQPGKQGSVAVYKYLAENFGTINAEVALHGLAIFGEHTADAKNRPGAHPNIDRLFKITETDTPISVKISIP